MNLIFPTKLTNDTYDLKTILTFKTQYVKLLSVNRLNAILSVFLKVMIKFYFRDQKLDKEVKNDH